MGIYLCGLDMPDRGTLRVSSCASLAVQTTPPSVYITRQAHAHACCEQRLSRPLTRYIDPISVLRLTEPHDRPQRSDTASTVAVGSTPSRTHLDLHSDTRSASQAPVSPHHTPPHSPLQHKHHSLPLNKTPRLDTYTCIRVLSIVAPSSGDLAAPKLTPC
jgi:hypothetical protein